MGLLSPVLNPGGEPPLPRRIVARDFREWLEFMHELVERRPCENYHWLDGGYLH